MRKILQAFLHRKDFESNLSAELRHHLEARAADLERQGLTKAEAQRQARLELGAPERYKEECRQARGLRWLDELRADLLYAVRGLRRNKAFAAVAIATLALGLGANTAVFSLVNAVMLKSLPVEKPDELRLVNWTLPEKDRSYHRASNGSSFNENGLRIADMFSYPHFTRLREETPGAQLFAWANSGRLSTVIHGEAQLARGLMTSWNYFQTLGIRAAVGRTFLPEDENPEAAAALLNHDFWTTAFRADPSVIGQTITIGTKPFTIAGVLQPGFHGLDPGSTIDVIVPLAVHDAIAPRPRVKDSRFWWVKIGARVPGHSERVRAELEAKFVGYLRAAPVPEPYAEPKIRLLDGARGIHWLRSRLEQPLRLITIVSLLILVMAVVNVGGLLLARTEARAAETSTRLALGAGRLRLLRQHLTENLMLGGLGTLGGLALTALLGGLLPSLFGSQGEAPIVDLAPDWRFFTIASLGCFAATLAMGLYPAWRASRLDLMSPLKLSRTGRLPLGRGLAAVQVALSLVLLIGAAMFLRTVANLRTLPLGFEPTGVLLFGADATLAGYRDERLLAFYERALAKLREVPGVRHAAMSRVMLLQGSSSSSSLYHRDGEGRIRAFEHGGEESLMHTVSPGYFDAAGISLLAGRDFTAGDTAKSQRVLIVNRTFARNLRPDGGSVIGMTLYEDEAGKDSYTIAGLVSDARYDSLRREAPPTYYAPFPQRSQRQASFLLKTNGDPLALAPAVRAALREVDPRVPIYDLRTQEEQISLAMERERSLAKLLTGFGALALTLALVGLYGVLTYSVTRRTPEIGIRMALGAAPAELRRMILGESLVPVLAGIAAGLAVTWWFSQLLTKLVFGVAPMDPWSIAGGVLVLMAGATLAAWLPAYRASRVSPVTALRYE